jgi:hypothetical protein
MRVAEELLQTVLLLLPQVVQVEAVLVYGQAQVPPIQGRRILVVAVEDILLHKVPVVAEMAVLESLF